MSAQRPEGRPPLPERVFTDAQFAPCAPCRHLALAEAEANAEYDWSKATDCRVLLRRHQASAECSARKPV
ncbi:hypothetical protein [Streptomyces sp. BBFR102]|uniref:hypothetical protein n=1 Tax=Streptomyces sp. BBFR102 TaxID=3448171 RepID=UPI003F53D220